MARAKKISKMKKKGKLATLGHRIFAWDSSNLNDENVGVSQ